MTKTNKKISQPITKMARGQIEESEQTYRAIFELSPDAIAIHDGKIVLQINPAGVKMLGAASAEELIGKPITNFIHPSDHDKVKARFERLREGESVPLATEKLIRLDGTVLDVEVATAPYWYQGAPASLVFIRDITERQLAEEALRDSEERFRGLSEATFEGISIHEQGIIHAANQAYAEFLGYDKPEDLIGKSGFKVFLVDRESFERVKAHLKTGSTEPLEITAIRPDGTLIMVETQGRDIIFKGRKMRVTGMRDITKRRQAEQTQVRLTTILEATPDFVAIADLGHHIIYINRAGRRMVGIGDDEDISGLKIEDVSPAWANEIIINEAIPAAIQTGAWSGDSARLARDGHEIPVTQVILAHKGADQELEYLSTISRDNTESKRAEEKIRRQLEHLTALSEIDRAITSSFDLKLSLKILLSHVTRQLGVDAADVLLFDPDKQTLEYIDGNGFRSQGIKNVSMNIHRGYAGRVILEHRRIDVPNLQEQPENFVRAAVLAEDTFISYIGVPLIAKEQVHGVLEIFHRTTLQPDEEWLDFLNALAEQAAIAIDNASLFNRLQRSNQELRLAYDLTIEGWSHAMDLRDKETEGHTLRVTEKTVELAHAMGIGESQLTHIRRGALLHDIGKIGVPDSILFKSGELNNEEWEIMRKHPIYAYEMLSSIAYLKPALDIPYCHHERWDGSGYPRGLKGEEIPLVARIFSVVDVWDALSSDRPYRKAWEKEKVREYIHSLAGAHFDPMVVDIFLKVTGET